MRLLFLVLICAISWGCRDAAEPTTGESPTTSPRAAVELTVLVVDDAELAKGIGLLAGEWSERSGGELAVQEMPLGELLDAENLTADVVIYPSRHLGTLVMRDWLRPVRQSVLDDPDLAWGDLLTTVRDHSLRYGDQTFALPLGESPLALAWNGSVPDPLPATWEQLGKRSAANSPADGTDYPLTKEFLARVLAATPPGDRADLFFDAETMEAKLTQPQMVRALEALSSKQPQVESYLTVSVALPREAQAARLSSLLPADEMYNASLDRWEPSEGNPPPVICGFAGRLVSVTTGSRNAASAFKLLPWLVSGSTGTQLSQRSNATLWFRASQVSQAGRWFGEKFDDDRVNWLTQGLSRGDAYLLPRIPGIDQYMTELEAEVQTAVNGEQSAGDALTAVAERWNALTDSLGRDEQRTAFHRHLGLTE